MKPQALLAHGPPHRLARDARLARASFCFVILAVAVGVGSLTGVRGFSRSFRHMLLCEARTLMAGDLTVRVFALPIAGAGRPRSTTWKRAACAAPGSPRPSPWRRPPPTPDPLLISVKAVDPAVYPFYGAVKLDPAAAAARGARCAIGGGLGRPAAAAQRAHRRQLRIGGQDFRIAGRRGRRARPHDRQPERRAARHDHARRAGPHRPDQRRAAAPPSATCSRCPRRAAGRRARCALVLEAGVSRKRTIADYRETHPIITRGLDRATTFLSLIGLIALVIGAMGVATAMHGHLQQKLDSIAVMKCMGARSAQIIRIYMAQTLMLGLGGGLIGVAVRRRRGGGVPRSDREILFDGRLGLLGRVARAAGHRRRVPGDAALHAAAVARDPRHPAGADLPPRCRVQARPAPARDGTAYLARAAILLGTGVVAGTLTEGSLSRRAAHRRILRARAGHRARAALARRLGHAARLPLAPAPRRRAAARASCGTAWRICTGREIRRRPRWSRSASA